MSVLFEVRLTSTNRWIEATCSRCNITGKMTSCFQPFKCHGELHSIPESVLQQFIDWKPVDPQVLEEAVRPWKARTINDGQNFDGVFTAENMSQFEPEEQYEQFVPDFT